MSENSDEPQGVFGWLLSALFGDNDRGYDEADIELTMDRIEADVPGVGEGGQ